MTGGGFGLRGPAVSGDSSGAFDTRDMKARYLAVLTASASVAVLVGWGIGSVHGACEQSCPPQGPCPEPPGCGSAPFNWTAAVVVGLVVGALVAAVALVILHNREP